MMKRIALGIEYDGSAFSGWQRQENAPSVQETLEQSLSKVANTEIKTVCAGRTDTGVHAYGQVVHFDTTVDRQEINWVLGVNSYVLPDVRVIWAKDVSMDFHARYSATARHYRYILYNHPIRPSLRRHYVGWYYRALRADKMGEAARHWLGKHDFSSFRAVNCQSPTPVREIHEIRVIRQGEEIVIDIVANAFLYHMVRNMIGTLIEIGTGQKDPKWAHEVLEARDRCQAGITFAPYGLYLVGVTYPEHFHLPQSTIRHNNELVF